MFHPDIDNRQFPERYVLDHLSAQERESFEEHLVDCLECQQAIRAAGALASGLKAVRPEFLAAAPPERFWFRRMAVWQGVALAAATFLLALAPGVPWYRAVTRSSSEQASALASLRDEVAALKQSAALQSGGNTGGMPVYALETVRGGGGADDPGVSLEAPAADGAVLLLLPGEAVRQASTGEVQDASGRTLWSQALRTGGGTETLGLTVPGNILSPGQYRFVLRAGQTTVARFPFHVTGPR